MANGLYHPGKRQRQIIYCYRTNLEPIILCGSLFWMESFRYSNNRNCFFIILYFIYGVGFSNSKKTNKLQLAENTIRYILIYLPLLLLSFLSVKFLDKPYNYFVGATITFIAAIYSLNHLKDILNVQAILKRLKLKK